MAAEKNQSELINTDYQRSQQKDPKRNPKRIQKIDPQQIQQDEPQRSRQKDSQKDPQRSRQRNPQQSRKRNSQQSRQRDPKQSRQRDSQQNRQKDPKQSRQKDPKQNRLQETRRSQQKETQSDQKRRPKNPQKASSNSGTIRNNMERYGTDSVSQEKARQATASRNTNASRKTAVQIEEKRQKTKRLIIRLSILFAVILICVACFLFTYRVFNDMPFDETNTTKIEITIPSKDITDDEVAQLLINAGCIGDARLYKLRTYIYDANYVPGTYKVSPSFSTEKIINILSGYDYSDGTMEE